MKIKYIRSAVFNKERYEAYCKLYKLLCETFISLSEDDAKALAILIGANCYNGDYIKALKDFAEGDE